MKKSNNPPTIQFNEPFLTGTETHYIYDAVNNKSHLSGNGFYTKKCQEFFNDKYGFKSSLLTSSCTDALEMCSILIDTNPGDEIIIPSYTFVSSALPFASKGATIKFADSAKEHPNVTFSEIQRLLTSKTKAIVVVHYAGQATEIDKIAEFCKQKNIVLIEDAAQAINVKYKDRYLGSYGDLATFSFHETKNIISGEGGLLAINNNSYIKRAEIIWEKGTNRASFFRGEVNKYGWVDLGSSFLPSELTAAFLWAQLNEIDDIISKRRDIWNYYHEHLNKEELLIKGIELPIVPQNCENNYHIFYLVCKSIEQRDSLTKHLKQQGINAVFHYLPLHKSEFYLKDNNDETLEHAERFGNCLLRLPLHLNLIKNDLSQVVYGINEF